MAYQNKDIYNHLEKLILQNEELIASEKETKKLIINLTKIIEEKDQIITKLENEIDRLKNKNNKDTTNSSKPSSTNMHTPKKKTGANLYNYRTKTNKKIGGQPGHEGKNLGKEYVETLINDDKVEVREIIHYIHGDRNDEDIIKYKIDVEVKTYVEKHMFKHRKKYKNTLPIEFYTDVTYGINIKSLSIHLGAYNVISYDRLSDFFNVISGDILNISNGTLVNFLYEFSNKSKSSLDNLLNDLLNSKTIFTDETGSKFNKKKVHVKNYSNEQSVIYKGHLNKGHKPIIADNVLPLFCGGIMGDHDTTLYSYGTKNYECNPHLGRYLEELVQNVFETNWAQDMKNLLFRMNETRKLAIQMGLNKFNKIKINEYYAEYDRILRLGKSELKNIKSRFYRDKAKVLINRLIKYKENHLMFIKNFTIPFDNNLSERDLRIFKTKTKISGGFRSFKGFEHFTNALSIIKTSIKRNINPFHSIKSIFENQILFA